MKPTAGWRRESETEERERETRTAHGPEINKAAHWTQAKWQKSGSRRCTDAALSESGGRSEIELVLIQLRQKVY